MKTTHNSSKTMNRINLEDNYQLRMNELKIKDGNLFMIQGMTSRKGSASVASLHNLNNAAKFSNKTSFKSREVVHLSDMGLN